MRKRKQKQEHKQIERKNRERADVTESSRKSILGRKEKFKTKKAKNLPKRITKDEKQHKYEK